MRERIALALVLSCVLHGKALTPEQARSDYDLLRKGLEEAHSGLYRFTPKGEMDRVFQSTQAKLTQETSTGEFRALVAAVLARIKCGHTGIVPDDEMRDALAKQGVFPLTVAVERRKLIVVSNDTASDSTIRPGMEILRINRRESVKIMDRILPYLTADGDIQTGRIFRLGNNFPRNYWLFVEAVDRFDIQARDSSGKTVSATLEGVKGTDRRKNAEANPANADALAATRKIDWTSENLAVRFLQDPDIAEIRIGSFGGQDYPTWVENTFKTLHEKGTKALILDLRGNGGGSDQYGATLVSYLTDKPFRYFDHIDMKTTDPSFKEHTDWSAENGLRWKDGTVKNPEGGFLVTPKLHPPLANQQPGKYPFTGKVMILIDGGSFSTTADVCAIARQLKRATFIGEETGGGYYGNNSGAQVILTLPNSGVKVRIPMWEYWNAVSGYDRRRGTRPDREVPTHVADRLKGVDPALDLARKLAM